jgi:tRNA modification GTPase
MNESETIAAMLTPLGRGAVAVIAVRGPRAEASAETHFRAANGKPVELQHLGRIVYGRWGDESGEELLLTRRSAGGLELHCHGGVAAPDAILRALESAGCRIAHAWEMLPGSDGDDSQRDAARALAEVSTERTSAILLDQYRGSLANAMNEIESAIATGDRSHALRVRVDRLLALADVGRHLTRPWRVVIAGQPNVGKSSLINALAGYDRAIVFDAPGTTRDALTVLSAIDGWPVEFSDTAGIRPTSDSLEEQAIERTRRRLSAAELVILVFDLSQPWTAEDEQLARGNSDAIVVHNKSDIFSAIDEGQRPAGLRLSARTGAGVGQLVREIGDRLAPHPPKVGEAVPLTDQHISRLLAFRERMGASG